MIVLTRLNGTHFVINSDLIESIEENPDTTVRMAGKSFFIVKESMLEIIEKVVDFRRATNGMIKLVRSEENRSEEKEG